MEFNENLNDKIISLQEKISLIYTDFVTNINLDSTLKRYTQLQRFLMIEDKCEEFVMKHVNDKDLKSIQEKFDQVNLLIDNEYYKKNVIDEKNLSAKKDLYENYVL